MIDVRDLKKTYENDGAATPVLHGVNFVIPRGQFVAIMGPSGSGKSTLMHILGLLDSASSGTYLFDGQDVTSLTEDQQADMRGRSMGFIFQAFHLLPKTTVLDNVLLPLLYSDIPQEARVAMAMKAIDSVGLSHRAQNLSNQLSGGERQRVAIARALIREPGVIFADEPTGNLDSKSGSQVMRLLQDLNMKQGHTIVLVTHETYTSEHAERVLRVKDGTLISDEPIINRRFSDGAALLK